MGRGRAKAKQTKVARDLKYHTQNTDFSALQHELAGEPPNDSAAAARWDDDERESDTDDGYGSDDRWASTTR